MGEGLAGVRGGGGNADERDKKRKYEGAGHRRDECEGWRDGGMKERGRWRESIITGLIKIVGRLRVGPGVLKREHDGQADHAHV